MTIAIDAMGGDNSPRVIVDAVKLLAPGERDIILVGDPEAIKACADEDLGVEICPATDVVGMGESPSFALKHRKASSLAVAVHLVREGRASALVSAGNTGAAMAFSMFGLGRLAGVSRPAIAVMLPSRSGPCLLLDAGANVDCRPEHLTDFALMGSVYSNLALGCETPRVGLLSIGSERSKGNELIFAAGERLDHMPGIHFVGNVEGGDITGGQVDVVVCDGFVGNSVLKFGEAVAEFIFGVLHEELSRAGVSDALVHEILRRTASQCDYSEYGGAALLGLNHGVIICHGRSAPKAIRNAIALAERTDFQRINERISTSVAQANVS